MQHAILALCTLHPQQAPDLQSGATLQRTRRVVAIVLPAGGADGGGDEVLGATERQDVGRHLHFRGQRRLGLVALLDRLFDDRDRLLQVRQRLDRGADTSWQMTGWQRVCII